MKKRFFLFGAVAALAMGGALTACSDDALDEGNNKVAEVDQTRYLHVTIANPPSGGSRAEGTNGNFQAGTELENYVHELYFVFYDAEGRVTGEPHRASFKTDNDNPSVPSDPNNPNAGTGFNPTDPNDNNVESLEGNVGKLWSGTVPVDLAQGDNLPAYVNVFINPYDFSQLQDKSLTELDNEIRMSGRLSDGHFPMSNSVYYGDNPINGFKDVRLTATPIISSQLYSSQTEAEKNPAISIYVERYAAKIKVNLKASAIQNTSTTISVKDDAGNLQTIQYNPIGGYSLKFVPEYFRVNAVDRNSFVIKRYGIWDDTRGVNYDPLYSELNNLMLRQWWNDPGNHRSYWAASPAYYKNEYPSVSDDVTDATYSISEDTNKKPVVTINEGTKEHDYSVYYFSYNEIKRMISTSTNISPTIVYDNVNGFANAFYANETTVASTAWGYSLTEKQAQTKRNYNPLATLPSAVVVGHYEVTKEGESSPLTAEQLPDGFWLFGKTSVEITQGEIKTHVTKWDLFESEFDVKKNMCKLQNVVMKNVGTPEAPQYRAVELPAIKDATTLNNYEVAQNVFDVKHPDQEIRILAEKTVAGRLEALQLNEANLPVDLYWYNSKTATYEPITANNIKDVNIALLTTGYATHYGCIKDNQGNTVTSGLAYFNIPVEHLGIYSNAENGTHVDKYKNENGLYNFENCPPGSFGLVRNHVYTIDVTKISGLATALRDGDQPIVPPTDIISYYLNAKINILNWRIVPTQSVTL